MDRRAFLSLTAALPVLPSTMMYASPRILILGDSVMWGQGLRPGQKIHTLLARMLYKQNGIEPSVLHYAHSGATIGFDEHGDVLPSPPVPDWWPREIPRPDPTIYEQCRLVQQDHPDERFDIVLVTGGINDVGVENIFDPLKSEEDVRSRTRTFCGNSMALLLDEFRARYIAANPNVRVIVFGYYSVLSQRSNVPNILDVIEVLAKETISPPKPTESMTSAQAQLWWGHKWSLRDALITNSEAFAEASRTELKAAVDRANAGQPNQNFAFLDPDFTDDDAAFAPQALLWGLETAKKSELPEDPVYNDRLEYCDYLLHMRPGKDTFVCDRASLGHPNIQGAQRYAQTAFSYLTGAN